MEFSDYLRWPQRVRGYPWRDEAMEGATKPTHPPLKKRRSLLSVSFTLEDWKRANLPSSPLLVSDTAILRASAPPVNADGGEDEVPFSLSVPCGLRPTARPNGGPDLRLQLLELRIGDPFGPAVATSAAAGIRWRRRSSLQSRITTPEEQRPAWMSLLDRSAGLLAAWLVFPDQTQGPINALASAWAVGSLAIAAITLVPTRQTEPKKTLPRLGRHPAIGIAARAAAQLVLLAEPAAALVLAGFFWSKMDADAFRLGSCLAALIPVMAGYNQTARECALGAADDAEEAWMQRHKWAAQRCAPLLSPDPPDAPPLGAVADAWRALDISAAVIVNGEPFGAWTLNIAVQKKNAKEDESAPWDGGARRGGQSPQPEAAAAADKKLKDVPRRPMQVPPLSQEQLALAARAGVEDVSGIVDSPFDWCTTKWGPEPAARPSREALAAPAATAAAATSSSDQPLARWPGRVLGPSQERKNDGEASDLTSDGSDDKGSFLIDGCVLTSDEEWDGGKRSRAARRRRTAFPAREEAPMPTALYGRADHSQLTEGPLSARDVVELLFRAFQLTWAFLPFFMVGVPLLLAAAVAASFLGGAATRLQAVAWRVLVGSCRRSGAALIKWSQWASVRRDIFPEVIFVSWPQSRSFYSFFSYNRPRSRLYQAYT
jgi:hypothetical protein